MAKPLELAGPPYYTLHWTMFIIIVLNGSFGLCGYLRFGSTSKGSISLNLPSGEPLAEGIKGIIAIGILLTYSLQLNVTSDLVWKGIVKKLVMREGEENLIRMERCYLRMRFGLILGTIIISSILPNIGPLISLIGSVGFSYLGIILPVIMETVWNWYPEDHYDKQNPENDKSTSVIIEENVTRAQAFGLPRFLRIMKYMKSVIVFSLGIFAMISGTLYNLKVMMDQSTSTGTF